jgi:hypothetical protein
MPNFGKEISRFKLVVYLINGKSHRYYSLKNEENKNEKVAIAGMVRRLLLKKHKGQYKTALLYDTQSPSDKPIQKWSFGIREF